MNQERIGKFIQKKRKEKEMTQQEFAEKIGVSNRTISKWETGRCLPDYSLINDICKELDVTVNELFQGKDIDEESYTIEVKRKRLKSYFKTLFKYVILILIIYIIYKSCIVWFYGTMTNYHDENENNNFPRKGNISTISVENNLMYNKEFNRDIRIYIPEDFVLTTDKAKSYLVTDNCDLYTKGLKENNEPFSYISVCTNYEDYFYDMEKATGMHSNILYNISNEFIENGIENPADLLKYYEKHYNDKNNFFTPVKKIKLDYIAKAYRECTISSYDEFYYLEGDLKGYFVKYSDDYYVINFNLGSPYEITISGVENEFAQEEVTKILNSIDRK